MTKPRQAPEPALFTHDGYRLYVSDDVPRMLELDIGSRLGMTEDRAIRKLIKRQEENLLLLGELGRRVPVHMDEPDLLHDGANRARAKTGPKTVAYYLTQQQVRWIVLKSKTPAADDLARQLLAVFDAWEKAVTQ